MSAFDTTKFNSNRPTSAVPAELVSSEVHTSRTRAIEYLARIEETLQNFYTCDNVFGQIAMLDNIVHKLAGPQSSLYAAVRELYLAILTGEYGRNAMRFDANAADMPRIYIAIRNVRALL